MPKSKFSPNGEHPITSAWSAYLAGPVRVTADEKRLVDEADQHPARNSEERELTQQQNGKGKFMSVKFENNYEIECELEHLAGLADRCDAEYEASKENIGDVQFANQDEVDRLVAANTVRMNAAYDGKEEAKLRKIAAKANLDAALARRNLEMRGAELQPAPERKQPTSTAGLPRFDIGPKSVHVSYLFPEQMDEGLRLLGEANGTNKSEEARKAIDKHLIANDVTEANSHAA